MLLEAGSGLFQYEKEKVPTYINLFCESQS